MKKIFLDTNVILDAILDNRKHLEEARIILQKGKDHQIQLFASFLTFANIAYIIRKHPKEEVYGILRYYSKLITVLPTDNKQLQKALTCEADDFEDMLQYQCAVAAECDCIITNNIKDFENFCDIPLFTSEDFLLNA